MKNKKRAVSGALAACAMFIIILDTKTALISAREGLSLCLQTVIPSLFPFFVLSGMVNNSVLGRSLPLLRPLEKLCKIPKGAESLLLLGSISGYPVGAQLIGQAYRDGRLSQSTARRMLGFCSNAGPAFIFGMLAPLFSDFTVPWVLWGIHIVSALIVGTVLPGNIEANCLLKSGESLTIPQALQNAIKVMAGVCGWVMVFRIVIGFCGRWFLWWFPMEAQVLISGLLELSNGCVLLQDLPSEGQRFVFASLMLSFGGLCVCMQTLSVTQNPGSGYYFPGKLLQTLISLSISILMQPIFFSPTEILKIPVIVLIIIVLLTFLCIYSIRRKKVVAIGRSMLYNTGKRQTKGAATCCFVRK